MATKVTSKRKRMGYATVASVLRVLQCHKEGKLNFPLNPQKLREVDVPEWNIFILYHAIEDLGFIRNGNTTEVFNNLARAYQTDQVEYQTMLKAHLSSVYADVLRRVGDVSHASQEQLLAAFKGYEPPKQHRRMVALFKGLLRQVESTSNEEVTFDETSDQTVDIESFVSPLNGVLPAFEEYKPMPEPPVTSTSNGTSEAHVNDSLVLDVLANFEQLHQQRNSTDWTEASRAMWEKQLNLSHKMLGQALKLMEGTKH